MKPEEPKEGKAFDSVEQLSKIAQDLVRRKTELAQQKQKTDDLSSYVQCISDAAQTFSAIRAESQYCYECHAFERASDWWNEHHGGELYINPTKYLNDDKMVTQPEQEPVATVDDNSQKWAGMDGAIAFHLIERHADNLDDIRKMMGEWLSANTPQRKPLTYEEIINKCLDSGFERNSLGWSFAYGKLDYHLLKLARAVEAAHEIKGDA